VGKPEGKRPLRRPRYMWVNINKMDVREIGWGGNDWIDLAQDRGQVVGSWEEGNETSDFVKCWKFLE
jgi:hypothetical protein